uniref:hypothetical protein n=1 Tax=uncultured Bacteroides sp. TaxID=162156 RepID=UPI00261B6394
FNEKQAFFDGKQAENSGKQVRKTSQNQPEYTDKQAFKHNSFKTNNTNTPIYINKEKEKERKKYFFYRKRRRRKRAGTGKDGKYYERPECPRPTNPTAHEQQLAGYRMYNGPPTSNNTPTHADDHSLWNARLQRREPKYG